MKMNMNLDKLNIFKNSYGLLFATLGVLIQVFAFIYTGATWLSLISGVTGIIAVVLCAERKMSFWIFAWIQLITYVILAIDQQLWGEVGENIFYAITMIAGMFIWNKNKEGDQVKAKQLTKNKFELTKVGCVLGIIALWCVLKQTNDTQPFMDSITTVPAIIAQIFMILAYREQWYFWLIIDVASIYMWAVAGNWCMAAQFVFWTANCLYGLKNWENEIS